MQPRWSAPPCNSRPPRRIHTSARRNPEPYATALAAHPRVADHAVELLLDEHFEPPLHTDLREAIGMRDLAPVQDATPICDLAAESPELDIPAEKAMPTEMWSNAFRGARVRNRSHLLQ